MENTFPGFGHKATELSAYLLGSGIFTMTLKTKHIIHFTPQDVAAFKAWLDAHKVRDVGKG